MNSRKIIAIFLITVFFGCLTATPTPQQKSIPIDPEKQIINVNINNANNMTPTVGMSASSANESNTNASNESTSGSASSAENQNSSTNKVDNKNTNTSTNTNTNSAEQYVRFAFKQAWDYASGIDPREVARKTAAYKYHIIGGSITSLYFLICGFLITGNHYLKRSDSWFAWKKTLTIKQLYEIPQQQLAKDLIHDIQSRYMSYENPTSIIIPLVQFVRAIEQEAHYINRYISLATKLAQLHILFLFPATKNSVKQAKRNLNRLEFVKHIFASWAIEYNMNNVGGIRVAMIDRIRKSNLRKAKT